MPHGKEKAGYAVEWIPEPAKSLAIVTLGFHETDGGRRSLQAFLLRTTRIMVALGYPEHWRIGR